MTPKQLSSLLSKTIPARLPVLVTGAPGIGKSDIVSQSAQASGADIIISHPAVADPTDAKGLPWPVAGATEATFLPFGELSRALKSEKSTVWFLDDLGQASPAVQCFPAGTLVQANGKAIGIEEVKIGDAVLDASGNIQHVTHTWKRHHDTLLTVSAVGILPISCTPEHPLLVSAGRTRRYRKESSGRYVIASERFSGGVWKEAKHIHRGDWIAVPIPQASRSDATLTIEEKGQTRREIRLTPEFAKLCGYYCGDGWYSQHKAVQSIGFALDDKYPDIQADLISLLRRTMDTHVYVSQKKGMKRIQIHDPALGSFLSREIGNESGNKRIPCWILYHRDASLLASFLQGYTNTDGARLQSGNKLRGVQWGTVSKSLALQLQLALTRFGTLAPIKLHCRKGQTMVSPATGRAYPVRDAYIIQCSDRRVLTALNEPFDAKRHVCWSYQHDGKIWTRVKSVKQIQQASEVYNLSVSVSETYTANNVAVHNCSFMQLLLSRRVNGHLLPDCVTFVAATNRRTDRAGVSGILEPVKSRFAAIVELTPELDDWCQWAFAHQIPNAMIAFLRFRPDLLSKFEASADLTNSPTPRTWHHAAKLEALALSPAVESIAIAGAVGEGAAAEYLAFRKMAASLVTVDQILLDPDRAAIPGKPAELYAVSVALAAKANEKNLGRVARYSERLTQDSKGEFAALVVRDAVRRSPGLTRTDAFVKLACGPLGQLISGTEAS